MNLHWIRTASLPAAVALAPATPGVYAFGSVERAAGLVTAVSWRYVGRATTRLGRRISQHRTVDEPNLRLRHWLASNPADLEIWFASTPTAEIAARVERDLISSLDPPCNVLLRPRPERRSGSGTTAA